MIRNKWRETRRNAIADKPWRERVESWNRIKRCYLDRGLPAEQFLSDHPEIVEKYNITKKDIDYVVSEIKKYAEEG